MLDVDVAALSLWLEREALPKVSDADPAALAEYILALLDTIDLTHLGTATKAECVTKLTDFFDTHTSAFVDALFERINSQRKRGGGGGGGGAAAGAAGVISPREAAKGQERNERRSSRSRSPVRSPIRDRSLIRSRSRERGRRGEENEERGREDEHDGGGRGHERRRSGGALLIRDDRYGIKQVVPRERDHREAVGAGGRGWRDQRDDRDGWHHSRPSAGGHDYRSSHSNHSSLSIARPFVPPPDPSPPSHRPSRTVHLPSSNPFAPSTSPPSSWTSSHPTNDIRVGHHTVVKRKRVEEEGGAGGGGSTAVVVRNAPRFVLSMRMLTDHFSKYGDLKGVEIREEQGMATIRYATAAEAARAVSGRRIHPAVVTSLDGAVNGSTQPQAYEAESEATEQEDDGEEEMEGEAEEAGDDDAGSDAVNGTDNSSSAPPPPVATIAVGKRTITLKAKPPPPPAPLEDDEVEEEEMAESTPTPPPAPGSALYAAQLIRQQRITAPTPSPTPPQPTPSPPTPTLTPMTPAQKEMKVATMKLTLLQKQIDTAVSLVEKLTGLIGGQVEGSAEREEMERKKAMVEATLEETRKRWRQERGKVVMLTLSAGSTGQPSLPAAGAV